MRAIAKDFHDAGLPEAEVAMMDYAVKLSTDAASMTERDAQRLRDFGFSDREIADITLAAAARIFFSRALLAMGAWTIHPEWQDIFVGDHLAGTPDGSQWWEVAALEPVCACRLICGAARSIRRDSVPGTSPTRCGGSS